VTPQWLAWARRLQAIAQNGLTYATSPYDVERYEEVWSIAAEMLAAGGGGPLDRIQDWFARESGYATPKVDVRAAVFAESRVLLVREREDGRWTLPGGWADVGDAPSEAVVRETKEESGYDVRVVKLAMLYDRDRHGHPPIPFHSYKLFFLCELAGGEPRASGETDGVGFFAEDDLPPLSLTRVTPEEIHRAFEHHRRRESATEFD
jgi:ADP-ribose pyrophosphatase YjhB (NUDIX family)